MSIALCTLVTRINRILIWRESYLNYVNYYTEQVLSLDGFESQSLVHTEYIKI